MNSSYGGGSAGRIETGSGINDNQNTGTVYICGSCGCDNEIRPKENIQCKECSGRIFYKKRTRRLVQYEAR